MMFIFDLGERRIGSLPYLIQLFNRSVFFPQPCAECVKRPCVKRTVHRFVENIVAEQRGKFPVGFCCSCKHSTDFFPDLRVEIVQEAKTVLPPLSVAILVTGVVLVLHFPVRDVFKHAELARQLHDHVKTTFSGDTEDLSACRKGIMLIHRLPEKDGRPDNDGIERALLHLQKIPADGFGCVLSGDFINAPVSIIAHACFSFSCESGKAYAFPLS